MSLDELKQRLRQHPRLGPVYQRLFWSWYDLRHGWGVLLSPTTPPLPPMPLVMLENWWFDRRHGVDTSGVIELARLGLSREEAAHGVRYQTLTSGVLRQMLHTLPIHYPDYCFVDLGCGKGKPLLIAGEMPFRKVIGVEFSKDLCAIARHNLEITAKGHADSPPWEVRCQDATLFQPPESPLVVFLNNPFRQPVMEKVLQKLEEHSKNDHAIHLIYFNPKVTVATGETFMLIEERNGYKKFTITP